jgi:hypothetical protein
LVPKDGHPQAVSHFVWFKTLEKAFECWDPVLPGQVQVQLPERVHANSYGWEGDMVTYDGKSPRLRGGMFVFDDTAVNVWADSEDGKLVPYVDGQKQASRGKSAVRDLRNSAFRFGRCRLGDRHVLEFEGQNATLTFVDAKVCPERRYVGMDSPLWVSADQVEAIEFKSEFGAPYGAKQVVLPPGAAAELEIIGTDVSVAYVDAPDRGTLRVLVDGAETLAQPTDQPFVGLDKSERFMENRKGILGLGFGVHALRFEAVGAPVAILGVFVYDSRPNRASERRLFGRAAPGETIGFSPPFKARPVVICHGGLAVQPGDVARDRATFRGSAAGVYEIVGE